MLARCAKLRPFGYTYKEGKQGKFGGKILTKQTMMNMRINTVAHKIKKNTKQPCYLGTPIFHNRKSFWEVRNEVRAVELSCSPGGTQTGSSKDTEPPGGQLISSSFFNPITPRGRN